MMTLTDVYMSLVVFLINGQRLITSTDDSKFT